MSSGSADEYLYDDEIYTPVHLVSYDRPPELVEELGGGRSAKKRRQERKGDAFVPQAILRRQPSLSAGISRQRSARGALSATIATDGFEPIRLTRGRSANASVAKDQSLAGAASAAALSDEASMRATPAVAPLPAGLPSITESPSTPEGGATDTTPRADGHSSTPRQFSRQRSQKAGAHTSAPPVHLGDAGLIPLYPLPASAPTSGAHVTFEQAGGVGAGAAGAAGAADAMVDGLVPLTDERIGRPPALTVTEQPSPGVPRSAPSLDTPPSSSSIAGTPGPVGTPSRLAPTPPPSPPEFLALSSSPSRRTPTANGVGGSYSPPPVVVPRLRVDSSLSPSRMGTLGSMYGGSFSEASRSSSVITSSAFDDDDDDDDEQDGAYESSARARRWGDGRVRGWLLRRRSRRRTKERIQHEMPCWKQYLQVTIGTAAMIVGSIVIIVNFSLPRGDDRKLLEPIPSFLAFISWGVAMPTSIVLHYVIRTVTRRLRIYAALRRGYRIKGMAMVSRPFNGRLSLASPSKPVRLGGADASAGEGGREGGSGGGRGGDRASAPPSRMLRPQTTAFLNPNLDNMPSWSNLRRSESSDLIGDGGIGDDNEFEEDLPTTRKKVEDGQSAAPAGAPATSSVLRKGRSGREGLRRTAREVAKEKEVARQQAEDMANRRLSVLRTQKSSGGQLSSRVPSSQFIARGDASHQASRSTLGATTPPTRRVSLNTVPMPATAPSHAPSRAVMNRAGSTATIPQTSQFI